MSKVPSNIDRLSKISEAIDESILKASEKDLREEIVEHGDDFDNAVARVGSTIERAKASAAKMRFEHAKSAARAYREESNDRPLDLGKARQRLRGMRADDLATTMMAARKGGKLSERDEDGIIADLARLQTLEDEAGEEGEE